MFLYSLLSSLILFIPGVIENVEKFNQYNSILGHKVIYSDIKQKRNIVYFSGAILFALSFSKNNYYYYYFLSITLILLYYYIYTVFNWHAVLF